MVLTMALVHCQVTPRITTATHLAKALKGEGVSYTSTERLPQPESGRFRFDEAIALVGEELRVEIIRIEDQRIYDIAKSAGVILLLAEAVAGQKFPGKPALYYRQPFIVVVRQEPVQGGVLEALDQLMPPPEE